jgi:FimV-like protein
MPSDLSIENNKDQQQFDLAVTYYEMNDKSSAKNILTNLIKDTEDDEIKTASQALLIKVDQ